MNLLPTLPPVDTSSIVEYGEYPSLTWSIDRATGRIVSMIEGRDAVQQAVEIALSIERYRWQIYSPSFGSELHGLVGKDSGYVMSEIQRRVTDALFADTRINSVDNFSFTVAGESLLATFTVNTVYGAMAAQLQVTQ